MSKRHWSDRLVAMGACEGAVKWARTQPSLAVAWRRCRRADWMAWLAGKVAGPAQGDGRRPLVLAIAECAERTLPLIEGEGMQGIATATVQTTQAWAHGAATLDDVTDAAETDAYAFDVAYTAVISDAAYAASAAVDRAAADVSGDDWYGPDHARALRSMAGIVRRHYPKPPRLP